VFVLFSQSLRLLPLTRKRIRHGIESDSGCGQAKFIGVSIFDEYPKHLSCCRIGLGTRTKQRFPVAISKDGVLLNCTYKAPALSNIRARRNKDLRTSDVHSALKEFADVQQFPCGLRPDRRAKTNRSKEGHYYRNRSFHPLRQFDCGEFYFGPAPRALRDDQYAKLIEAIATSPMRKASPAIPRNINCSLAFGVQNSSPGIRQLVHSVCSRPLVSRLGGTRPHGRHWHVWQCYDVRRCCDCVQVKLKLVRQSLRQIVHGDGAKLLCRFQ
jgi:hypothetical protein